jgi:hypothetical protein
MNDGGNAGGDLCHLYERTGAAMEALAIHIQLLDE